MYLLGTTLVLLASDAFSTYQEATGGVLDETTGLLKLTADQFNNLQSLFFNIENVCHIELVEKSFIPVNFSLRSISNSQLMRRHGLVL